MHEENNEIPGGVTDNEENNNVPGASDENNQNGNVENVEELPENLPKTGMTQYVYIITAIAVLGAVYISLKSEKSKQK